MSERAQRSPSGRPVRVVRSTRRRRTVEAHVRDGAIEVAIPAWYSAADEDEAVAMMVARLETKIGLDDRELTERAARLAARFGLPEPAEVRWSTRQQRRWGSCTPATRHIRLSAALRDFPGWVLDYVLVHELAHLVHADHSPAFNALVDQYPRAERARGYLIAKGMGERSDEVVTDPRGHADASDASAEAAPRLF